MLAIVRLWWWQLFNTIRRVLSNPANLVLLIPVFIWFVSVRLLNTIPIVLSIADFTPTSGPDTDPSYAGAAMSSATTETLIFLITCFFCAVFLGLGFMDQFLLFVPADFTYLFASPISNRMILASRLPKTVLSSLLMAIWVQGVAFHQIATALNAQSHETVRATLLATLALFCLGGYSNLAAVIEINRRKTHLGGAVLYYSVLIGFVIWLAQHRQSAEVTANMPCLRLLFLPCRLAAHALIEIVLGRNIAPTLATLVLFYAATLALIFARNVNFTERSLALADRRQAARDAAKDGSYHDGDRLGRRQTNRSRIYTLPAFGSGAWALLWANLVAAFKHPWVFFAGPYCMGILMGTAGLSNALTAGHTCQKLCLTFTFYGAVFAQFAFWVGRSRQTLIRPLPFNGWQVALADVAPVAAMLVLFQWGVGTMLLCIVNAPDKSLALFAIFACMPAAGVCFLFIVYGATAWRISAQDVGQAWLSLAAGPIAIAVFSFLTAGLMAILTLLKAPDWAPLVAAFVFCIATAPGLLALSGYLYSEFRPEAIIASGRATTKPG